MLTQIATRGATAKARRWLAAATASVCLAAAVGFAAIEVGHGALEDFGKAGVAPVFGLQKVARAYALEVPAALNGVAQGQMGFEAAGYALQEARGRAATAWAGYKTALARGTSAERMFASEIDVLILSLEGALDQAVLILATSDRTAVAEFLGGEFQRRLAPLDQALERAGAMRRERLDAAVNDAHAMRLEFIAVLATLLAFAVFAGWRARHLLRDGVDRPLAELAAQAAVMVGHHPPGRSETALARIGAALDAWRDARTARREAAREAESAQRAKSSFLNAMRHRVRTPLHALLGLVEIDAASRARGLAREGLGDLRRTAESLMAVVDDLIDFARIDTESPGVDLRATDAGDVLERAALNLAGLADAKGLTLSCFVDPEIVERYKIDPLRVRQILFNLIGDAIARTAQGGVHARLSLSDGALIFAVADTGPRDGETPPDEVSPGLPVCRLLAARMGGRLRASANHEGGTTFALELPAEPAGGALGPVPPGNALSGRRVAVLGERGAAHAAVAAYLIAAGAVPVDDRRDADLCVALPGTHDFGTASGKRLRLHTVPPHGGSDDADADETLLRRAAIVAGAARALGIGAASVDEDDPIFHPVRAAPSREVALAQGTLILAVDDHPVTREVLVRQLELAGWRADAAARGQEAWAMWRATAYGLVIAELRLPDLDARDLARRIRAAETETGRMRVPILALSVTADGDEIGSCHDAGMDGVLGKPLAWRRLVEAVRRHLGEKT